ncbi:PAS domain-containing sensor histidine kinase [Candidatus Bathyarchaeota archaeon]|nr:PAS domain-containing sensor histidine kinase [Candidatus Bathyarchaeota archaeon]
MVHEFPIDLLPDPAVLLDLNDNIIASNKSFNQIPELKNKLIQDRSLKNKILPSREKIKKLQNLFRSNQSSRPIYEVETEQSEGKNKSLFEVNSKMLDYKDQQFELLTFRDVTESKKAEEELRKSEIKYRSLVEESAAGVATTDMRGKFDYVNKSLCKMMGYRKEEMVGKYFWEFLAVEDKKKIVPKFWNAWRQPHKKLYLEFKGYRKNNDTIHMASSPTLFMFKSKIAGFNAIITDITPQKKLEEELRQYSAGLEDMVEKKTAELAQSTKFLEDTIESVPDLLYIKDKEGKFVFANDAYCRFHGRPKKDIIGKTVYDLYQKDHAENFAKHDETVFGKEEAIVTPDIPLIDSKGNQIIIQTIKAPLKDDQGQVTHLIGIARNITERKQLEKMKDQFISAVTHELQTPLVSIKAYIDYPLTGKMGPLSENMKSNLEIVKRNTDRLLQLTGELLDLRRMESGRLELNKEDLDYQEIINNCLEEISPLFDEKQQILNVQLPPGQLNIQGDKIRLSQILMNLLSNANKFTPAQGGINVTVENTNGEIRTTISDSGIGIRKGDMNRIFEPFSSIKKPTYIKGTGLGLSVTKGLIEAHGGKITVKSQGEGKGSSITFNLPKSK